MFWLIGTFIGEVTHGSRKLIELSKVRSGLG